jgi:hypothetical protein
VSIFSQRANLISDDEIRAWLRSALAMPIGPGCAGSIAISTVGDGFSLNARQLGLSIENRLYGLDLSCVRHTWREHGGVADKCRDQIPVTFDDLIDMPNILENSTIRIASERPRTRGKIRLECFATYDEYVLTAVVEIRKRLIVPVTMWKRRS